MTVTEKAAYLKGLTDGLGLDPDSKDGKLWTALNDLLSDMAHAIEDLQATSDDYADALDEMADELSYLEEITCDLDDADDYCKEQGCSGECGDCCNCCGDEEEILEGIEDGDEILDYDGVIYDATCPVCGEEISFDEETLEAGSIQCPKCGETLEFDLDADDEEEMKF